MTDQKHEAVARAMWDALYPHTPWEALKDEYPIKENCRIMAAAAITAYETITPESGMVIVPRAALPAILTGVQRQVDWNGWEEPYLTQRFMMEVEKAASQETKSAA